MALSAPRVSHVVRTLPPHYADQESLIAAFRELWSREHYNLARLEDLHRNVQVRGRHLARPIGDYPKLVTFKDRNDAWIEAALEISERSVRALLAASHLEPRDLDHVFFVTVTGLATPSIDARLVNRLGLRPDVKRTPIFGLGCVAGAAGLARAADYLRAFPEQRAVLLSVELCSLTLQREDLSIPNIIASGLFGDGAAAVLLQGGECDASGPEVTASTSVFYPDTERVMGWDIVDTGFKVVLNAQVPHLVRQHVGRNVDDFLALHGTRRSDIHHWIAHTGGPKVLDAFQSALELPADALARSWRSLEEVGNLSSASVLHVLGDLLESGAPKGGEQGVLMAMGPGFCSEMVLLQWR